MRVKTTIMLLGVCVIAAYAASAADWYDDAWWYRHEIIIPAGNVDANLTDFPLLISPTDGSLEFWSGAQANGDDIMFTSSNGTTKLAHQIEKYDPATTQLCVWVKALNVYSAQPTVLYMYYGNCQAGNQEDKTNVWDNDHGMVLHMDETSGSHEDSTKNGNDVGQT